MKSKWKCGIILLLMGLAALPVLAQNANPSESTSDCRQFLDEKDNRAYSPNEIERAIFHGETEKAVNLLRELTTISWDPNRPFRNGFRLLHFAARSGSSDLIMQLLRLGALPNLVDHFGETPFLIAARECFIPCLIALALKKANIQAVNTEGKNALHLAMEKNDPKVAEALLRLGVDTQIKDTNGKLPRDYASSFEIRGLFEKKAVPGRASSDGTPEYLWETIQNDIHLYESDKQKIQEILDDPALESPQKYRQIREIASARGVTAVRQPATDYDPEDLWNQIKEDFRLYSDDKEKIQQILDNSELSNEKKFIQIKKIATQRGIKTEFG